MSLLQRLSDMAIFSRVAETGSFTQAAVALQMSKGAVSKAISRLEQHLAVRLLQRTTRQVTLTDAGENCLRRCQQMLALADSLQEETDTHGDTLRGLLRVTCSVSLAYAQLAAMLTDFLARHPQLKIDLNASEAALNLVEARVDLAIRISSEPDPMLIARPLAACESHLVAAPAYLARLGRPERPEDLGRHRCLSYANFGRHVWRLSRAAETREVAVSAFFSANEATALMQATLAGAGIALLPTYLVHQELAAGRLQIVLPDWQLPTLTIQALYPSRRQLSPAVRALLDELVLRFADPPWQAWAKPATADAARP